jgi:SAM-dependent methyltransferase
MTKYLALAQCLRNEGSNLKCRESGMPDEASWSTFFNAEKAISKLWPEAQGDVLELGCGYGTFTFAVAPRTTGRVTALDIEPDMVDRVNTRAAELGVSNIHAVVRNFVIDGFGVKPGSQTHIMIYNLLHMNEPVPLLRKAYEALHGGGTVSVMHWRTDIPTPRGPPLDIRPTLDMCATWLEQAGFSNITAIDLSDCCPFHYGLTAVHG